jgi:hypothetical protein
MVAKEQAKAKAKAKEMKTEQVILLAIEGDRSTPVRMARIVKNYTKDALRDFVRDWAEEYTSMDEDEIEELVNGVWNDGDKWWWDETWCIQVYRD